MEVVDICSSDDEKVTDTIIIDDDDNSKTDGKTTSNKCDTSNNNTTSHEDHEKVNKNTQSPKLNNVQGETSKRLTITVEDTSPDHNNLKSTKIVIEIDETKDQNNINDKMKKYKDEDFSQEFLQLIELCLKYEFSDGMNRIINRNLIPCYMQANESYTKSLQCQNYLEVMIKKLQNEPHRKFAYLKDVCEVLKSHKLKKRVELITLDKEVSKPRKRRILSRHSTKKSKVDIIDLDRIPDVPTIVVDDDQDTVIFVDDNEKENMVCNSKTTENTVTTPINNESDATFNYDVNNSETTKDTLTFDKTKANEPTTHLASKTPEKVTNTVPGFLLTPRKNNYSDVSFISNKTESELLDDKVRLIEEAIKCCKEQIKRYEEMEVCEDKMTSPYIIVDIYKTEIVKLYKELCKITGNNSTPNKVNIKMCVADGHPPGPAKKLQQWLNENQNRDGELVFPDLIDVIKCVTLANEEDCLRWSKNQILAEARALFIQCGKALQQRRQKREWRDLVCKVEDVDIEHDPADEDLELQTKLENNRLIALQKESEILEYYTNLNEKSRSKADNKITVVCSNPEPLMFSVLQDKCFAKLTNGMIEIEVPPMDQSHNNSFHKSNDMADDKTDQVPNIEPHFKLILNTGGVMCINEDNQPTLESNLGTCDSTVNHQDIQANLVNLKIANASYGQQDKEHNLPHLESDLNTSSATTNEQDSEPNLVNLSTADAGDKQEILNTCDAALNQQNIQSNSSTANVADTFQDIKPVIVPLPIDPNIEIVCSDSEDYSTSEDELSDFELDSVIPPEETCAISSKVNDTEKSINNVVDKSIEPGESVAENSTIDKESTNARSETTSTNMEECEDAIIKAEIKTEPCEVTAADTLRMLLDFDAKWTEGVEVKTILFDTEPSVHIEISSSESESDSDDDIIIHVNDKNALF